MGYTLEKSPLSELVLGVQYDGPAFTINAEIEIYTAFKSDFPEITEVPPLPAVIEDVDAPQTQRILNDWVSRKHFIARERDRLIQIQPDRILFNWRKEDQQTKRYPRFDIVYKTFHEILNTAEKHLQTNSQRNQYEMTYVDHVPLKSFDLDNYDMSPIFKLIEGGRSYKNLLLRYSIAHQSVGGVINATIKSGIRKDNKDRIVVLEATCRGFLPEITVDEWFSKAHKLLLEHFSDITTDRAKKTWGFKEE